MRAMESTKNTLSGNLRAATDTGTADVASVGDSLDELVGRARGGDPEALEDLVAAIQDDVFRLALRFLWHPQDAEDAAQEILVRIITRLSSFEGRSSFKTWAYRVACNRLLTLRKQRAERQSLTASQFADDLAQGLSDKPLRADGVEERAILEEVKIGCTLAMLLCLDRPQRTAFILGEILELDHGEAAEVLEVSPAAYRTRLSRARATITDLMEQRCGLVEPANACRCHKRANTAIDLGRVDPHELLFVSSRQQGERFPQVLDAIRQLEVARRAAALYRSHELPATGENFAERIRELLDGV